jgi:predicted  nucleic acid-binding Zn-ribbon protein
MATASLAVRLSAQIAEFQKAFQDATRQTDRFKTTFGGAASEIEKHQARINRAMDAFSGDKIVREANAYAQAVQRVGGAAKLTESEQRRVNAAVPSVR